MNSIQKCSFPILVFVVVLYGLVGTVEGAIWPVQIDSVALGEVEETRSNNYRHRRIDYIDDISGLSVSHGYIYRAASAPEGLFGYRQGWDFMCTGYSSLKFYIVADTTEVTNNPYLQDLPAGEYALVEIENGIIYRFKLENDEWKGVDGWSKGTLSLQPYTSGSGRWEYQGHAGTVSIFNEEGLMLEHAANNRYYTYSYNAEGLLTVIQAQNGETLTFSYNTDGRISSFANSRGETTRYEYDDQGRLTAVIKPDNTLELSDNPTEYYQYSDVSHPLLLTGIVSTLGYLVFDSYYDNTTDELVYKQLSQANPSSAAANLIRHTEEFWSNGLRIHFVNEEQSATTNDGRTFVGIEEVSSERQHAQDAGHYIERITYRLENAKCSNCVISGESHYGLSGGKLKSESLYANGLLVEEEFVEGAVQDGESLPLTRRETLHDQLVKYTSWSGAPENNVIISEEKPGRITTYQYDESGRATSKTLADTTNALVPKRITSYQYEGGQLVFLDGPRTDVNDTVQFEYDGKGNLVKVANGLAQVVRHEFDEQNRRTATIDVNGLRTEVVYGTENRILSKTFAAATEQAVVTQYEYDADGNMSKVTLANGKIIAREYDAQGRVIKISDQDGNQISYQYDAGGNLIEEAVYDHEQQRLVHLAQQVFDDFGRIMTKGNGDVAYQYQGGSEAPASISSGSGANAQLEYDQYGRLTGSIDALGGESSYQYNTQGKVTQIIDARSVVTSYEYNGFGERTAEHSPSKGTLTYKYDEAGNVVKETRENGIVIKRQFDALNRLTKVVFKQQDQEKKRLNYTYDDCDNGIGRLCKVSGAGSTTRYDYDLRGNFSKVKTKLHDEAQASVTKYEYDEHNQLTHLLYPSGLKVRYHYNSDGDVVKVTGKQGKTKYTIAENIQYRPMQNGLSQITFGNGLTTELSHNQQGQLERLVTGNVQDLNYQYDANGNISQIDRPLRDNWLQLFDYDELNRLINEAREGQAISYEYDGVGNRLSRSKHLEGEDSANTKQYQYAESANRLDKINNKKLIYDLNGNLIEDKSGKRKFRYDVTNRLTEYFKDGELKSSYTYNSFGQRIKKTIERAKNNDDDHKSLTFTYLPSGWLLSENGHDDVSEKGFTRDYIWLGSKPIAQIKSRFKADGSIKNQEINYIHTDHLHTPRVATDENQNIVWRWDSDAFGEQKSQRDPDSNGKKVVIRLRFPGQYFDGESKLHYNHYRDYDPRIGRYIQGDPIGLDGGYNLYLYGNSNPINNFDPEGKSWTTIDFLLHYMTGGGATVDLGSVGLG